jgi:hypothetical protein
MLFYVFLFALRQTKARQDAWFRSFLTWLGLDTLLVCTFVVVFSNIVVPSFIMKDISKLKEHLLSTLHAHRRSIGQVAASQENDEKSDRAAPASAEINGPELNSADYFFISSRICRMEEFQHLLVASMISKFSTPWPRQSYQHAVQDDTTTTAAATRSHYWSVLFAVKSFLVFLIGGFVQLPPSFQDSVVYMAFSVACGYIVVLLTQLYSVHPALIAIPVTTALVLTHYTIQFITAARQRPATLEEGAGQGDGTTPIILTNDLSGRGLGSAMQVGTYIHIVLHDFNA